MNTLKKGLYTITLLYLSISISFGSPQIPSHSVHIVPEVSQIKTGTPFWVAIDIRLPKGWHTYWKNPGHTGLAPTIQWTSPHHIITSPIQYPVPEQISIPPFVNFGYHNRVTFLQSLTIPKTTQKNITLTGHLEWLICADICLPIKSTLHATLPISSSEQVNTKRQSFFKEARAKLPPPSPHAIKGVQKGTQLRLHISHPNTPIKRASFYPITSGIHFSKDPIYTTHSNSSTLQFKVNQEVPLKTVEGILLLTHQNGTREPFSTQISIRHNQTPTPSKNLIILCGLAFLGGLLLNLMPCVLPILSIKILSLVDKPNQNTLITSLRF